MVASNVFFTSDLHLGHLKVASLRKFEKVEDHDTWLAATWDSQIKQTDVIWLLGDLTVNRQPVHALEWLSQRPGIKHLVAGNHDSVHNSHRESHKHMKMWMQEFESIQMFARRKIYGRNVLLSHFPYWSYGDGPDRDTARYEQYRLVDLGQPLLHGHVHGLVQEHGHSLHIGIDAWEGLVPLEVVAEWVRTLPSDEELVEKARLRVCC